MGLVRLLVATFLLLTCLPAGAACPGPACFAGGGRGTADCLIEWSGVSAAATSCVDGAACDVDGQADGVCTFPLAACLGEASSCPAAGATRTRVSPARLPVASTLRSAIERLAPGECTAPGLAVPVKRRAGLGPMKPGVVKLKVVAKTGSAKDTDGLRLTCQPATPSFANDVQPVLTQRCATSGCHGATFPAEDLDLSPDAAYAEMVGAPSEEGGKLLVVSPGSIAKSFLARKILGKGLRIANGSRMPLGCPAVAPFGGCPTEAELYTLLAWIQAGAPAN
jgi:hypothetical protein